MKKKYLIVTLCLLSTLMTACAGTDLSNKNTNSYIEETESSATEDVKKSDKSDENTKIKNDSTENNSQKETESSKTENTSETSTAASTEVPKSDKTTEVSKDNITSVDNIKTNSNTNNQTPNNSAQSSSSAEQESQAPSKNNEPQDNPAPAPETPSPESPTPTKKPTKEDKLVIERTYSPLNNVEDSKINDVFCDVGSYLGEDYLPKMSIFTNEIIQTCSLSKNSVEYAYGEAPFLPTDKDFFIAIKTLDGSQELIEKSAKEYVDLLKNDSGQDSATLAKYQSIEVYRYDRYVFIIGTFGKCDDTNTDTITKTSSENIQKALAAIKNNF